MIRMLSDVIETLQKIYDEEGDLPCVPGDAWMAEEDVRLTFYCELNEQGESIAVSFDVMPDEKVNP